MQSQRALMLALAEGLPESLGQAGTAEQHKAEIKRGRSSTYVCFPNKEFDQLVSYHDPKPLILKVDSFMKQLCCYTQKSRRTN